MYRYSPVASHIVGYVGRIPDTDEADEYRAQGYLLSDIVGRSGIEMSFESDLRGTPGYVKYEVDANNRVVQEVERVDPIPGRDVQLAIDLKMQQYAEQILEAGLKEARGRTPKEKPGRLLQGARRVARGRGPAQRRDPGHGLQPAVRQPVLRRRRQPGQVRGAVRGDVGQPAGEPGHPGPVPAGLHDEAVHVRGGAQLRDHPLRQLRDRRQGHLRHPQVRRRAERLREEERRRRDLRQDQPPRGAAGVQRRLLLRHRQRHVDPQRRGPEHPPGRGPELRPRRGVGHRPALRAVGHRAHPGGEGRPGRGEASSPSGRARTTTRATTSSWRSARACSRSRRCSW